MAPRPFLTGYLRLSLRPCHTNDGAPPFDGKMADDDLVRPPPVPPCDHPARRLAVFPLHAQLSRRRRPARRAWAGYLLRDGAAMGLEIRAVVRPRTSPSTPAANGPMASRRDGRDDCGQAVLALARGR